MSKAIIIAQYAPPAKYIATVRITAVANQFAKAGYDVSIFSSNNYKYYPTDKYALDERVRTVRTNSNDFLILRKKFVTGTRKLFSGNPAGKEKESSTVGVDVTGTSAESLSTKIFYFLSNYLPFSLLMGEGSIWYIIASYFRLLREVEDGTIIFSSFRPYSDHIIAYLVKLRKPGVFWIADFRDPQLPPNNNAIFFRVHKWVNKRIFKRANVVTTVSKGVLRNLEGYNARILLLRNAIVGTYAAQNSAYVSPDGIFRVIYTGGMYGGVRNPNELFRVVKELVDEGKISPERFHVVYAGGDKKIWDGYVANNGISALNESYNMLSIEESKKLQATANINLLLTWSDRNYKGVLTGKMYEYFGALKPILTIINGDRDTEIEEIIQEIGASETVYSVPDDRDKIRTFITKHYDRFIAGESAETIDRQTIKQFYWDETFPQFLTDLQLGVV